MDIVPRAGRGPLFAVWTCGRTSRGALEHETVVMRDEAGARTDASHAMRRTFGLGPEPPFYFVHSFTPRPASDDDVLGTAAYGERFACAVERPPLYGVQFHPEKSSTAGLGLLANFVKICTA